MPQTSAIERRLPKASFRPERRRESNRLTTFRVINQGASSSHGERVALDRRGGSLTLCRSSSEPLACFLGVPRRSQGHRSWLDRGVCCLTDCCRTDDRIMPHLDEEWWW